MSTTSNMPPSIVTEAATFIGIDYHKKYSVWHAWKRGQWKRGQCATG